MTFLLSILGLFLLPEHASTQGYGIINNIVNGVGGLLPSLAPGSICDQAGGACGFVHIAEGIITRLRPLILLAASVIITIAGFRMIIGQEDEAIGHARTTISACVAGVILSYLTEPFVLAFYGTGGEVPRVNIVRGSGIVTSQVLGVINWALVIVAALAVTMIITSAVKALSHSASEEGISGMRRTLFSVAGGIILIALHRVLVESIGAANGTPTPIPVISAIVRTVSYCLGFLGLIATTIFIYAGILMILNFGKDEQVQQAKGLIIRAIIGLVVILVSLALVNFVITGVTG